MPGAWNRAARRKPRSAKDVPELQQAWEVAVAGEFVLVTANRAGAARNVAVHAEDGALPPGLALFLFAGAIRQMVADGADIAAVPGPTRS